MNLNEFENEFTNAELILQSIIEFFIFICVALVVPLFYILGGSRQGSQGYTAKRLKPSTMESIHYVFSSPRTPLPHVAAEFSKMQRSQCKTGVNGQLQLLVNHIKTSVHVSHIY